MTFVDISRVRELIDKHNLDGLLVTEPENFTYFSGVSAFPATLWRRAGPAAVVVNRDGEMTFILPDTREGALRRVNPDANILTHTLWIEWVDVDPASGGTSEELIARATEGREVRRPETYDLQDIHNLLRNAVGDAGLIGKRLGVELEFAPAIDVEHFHEILGDTEIVNSSPLIRELRMIKTPREIELHRTATQVTETAIMGALEGLDEGTITLDIQTRFYESVQRAVRDQHLTGYEGAFTTVNMGPQLWGTADPMRTAQRGDNIQFDSGIILSSYRSDIGRTFAFGKASDVQKRIQEALLAGFEAGREQIRPGKRYCDVHQAAQQTVRDHGFPSYTRGHVGHSIGSEVFGEEWPFFSATETHALLPGMVVAFEVPYYVNGVGAYQNEDNFLITEDGNESFNTLPMELIEVG